MKILFFIESLRAGGAERRVVELLSYLNDKAGYELKVVLTRKEIHYVKFLKLEIPYEVLERKWMKKDPRLFFQFYSISKKFKPDIVHSWGNMASFYAVPTTVLQKVPLVNSQIANAPPKISKWSSLHLMSAINFRFSTAILANSNAGLISYGVSEPKGKVIYNGVDLKRFDNLQQIQQVREKYGIKTPYSVIMVASFSDHKDYDLFIDVAKIVNSKRQDVTFLAVGGGVHFERIMKRVLAERLQYVILTGKLNDVENLVNISDIGILFSNRLIHGEGISNTIIEYMAMRKPVIANDAGGTREIVNHEKNGYLITNESPVEIANLINILLKEKGKRIKMGEAGRWTIEESFSIDKMGREFEMIYKKTIAHVLSAE